ncbi:uncharacterized protein LY79DRAFT_542957, partial [Colletotrichum navitas]
MQTTRYHGEGVSMERRFFFFRPFFLIQPWKHFLFLWRARYLSFHLTLISPLPAFFFFFSPYLRFYFLFLGLSSTHCFFLHFPSSSSHPRTVGKMGEWGKERYKETGMGFVSRGVYPWLPSQRTAGGQGGGNGEGGRLHLVILNNSHHLFLYNCRGHWFGGIGRGVAAQRRDNRSCERGGKGSSLGTFIFPLGAGGGKKRKGVRDLGGGGRGVTRSKTQC